MMLTPKPAGDTSLTVRLTPSTATEPLGAMNGASSRGASIDEADGFGFRPAFDDPRDTVDMTGDEMPAELVADPQRSLEIDRGALLATPRPSCRPGSRPRPAPRIPRARPRSPSGIPRSRRSRPRCAIAEVSKAVAIVRSTRSPRRSRFTLPRSVTMPVNIPVSYGPGPRLARGSELPEQPETGARRFPRKHPVGRLLAAGGAAVPGGGKPRRREIEDPNRRADHRAGRCADRDRADRGTGSERDQGGRMAIHHLSPAPWNAAIVRGRSGHDPHRLHRRGQPDPAGCRIAPSARSSGMAASSPGR